MDFATRFEIFGDLANFCSTKKSPKACLSVELSREKSPTCHGTRPMGTDSSMRVLGQARGTIPDIWGGCLHTFPALSRFTQSVEIRDMPETTYENRRLIWKIAPGGAIKVDHFSETLSNSIDSGVGLRSNHSTTPPPAPHPHIIAPPGATFQISRRFS